MSTKEYWELGIGVFLAGLGVAVSQGYPPWLASAHWLPLILFVVGGGLILVALWRSFGLANILSSERVDQRAIKQSTPGASSTAVAVGSVGKGDVHITINHPSPSAPLISSPARDSEPKDEGLKYSQWTDSAAIGAALFYGKSASLVAVENTRVRIPVAARKVVASITFEKTAGARLVVLNAPWWETGREGTIRAGAWKTSIESLRGGPECQHFALYYVDQDGKRWALKDSGTEVGLIDDGEWTITFCVTSENLEGFEATGRFIWAPSYFHRGPKAFTTRRILPPRIQ
jgi:hypothetical protein